jgi:hypothetical protein
LSEGKVLGMIVEKDLGGVFKWIVVDEDLVFVDPIYLEEYETSVLKLIDKAYATCYNRGIN